MASNQSKLLVSLNGIDSSIVEKEREIKKANDVLEELQEMYRIQSLHLEKIENNLENSKMLHSEEEKKLKEEEEKIVERRKQLTSLGGAKSAKLVERELDIAKRIMDTLEQNVLSLLEQVETHAKERETLVSQVEEVRTQLNDAKEEHEKLSSSESGNIEELKKERKKILSSLDARLQNLYKRVESRYRGDAVAYAENGSCRSCFRALPAQTFNQVMAGYNLIQCPGCSRILVFMEEDQSAE